MEAGWQSRWSPISLRIFNRHRCLSEQGFSKRNGKTSRKFRSSLKIQIVSE
ncbi:hypothetical protein I79_008615 [Cricetulus griseus]|uniref:Uncharacterized protein n=1 Tax=Cricetulus griseus TaxID=10029 RepID=G3HDM9_CRIGR|nr:hypothetical protein I79_008615 [Cricetulus griseus]